MAEEGLDGADVGPVHEEVGGEGMTESVWGDMFGDICKTGIFFDNPGDGTGSEAAKIARSVGDAFVFAVVEKEGGKGIGAGIEIILDAVGGVLVDEDGAIFGAFAADDKFAAGEVNRGTIEAD